MVKCYPVLPGFPPLLRLLPLLEYLAHPLRVVGLTQPLRPSSFPQPFLGRVSSSLLWSPASSRCLRWSTDLPGWGVPSRISQPHQAECSMGTGADWDSSLGPPESLEVFVE